jgi:hypothetical protein
MRSGNYILTTNHLYLPTIINKNNGTLVQPKSVSEIVETIEMLISNSAHLRFVQNANIDYAKTQFNESIYLKNIFRILEI